MIGIALDFQLALRLGTVELLVVRQRMRIGTNHVPVHERRALAGANVVDGRLHRGVAGEHVGAIDFGEMEIGESLHQLADVAARRVDFHRHGDGVLVVFDHEQHRQLEVRGGVQRLPELALAGRAVAGGDVHHFVAVEDDVLEFA